MMVAKWVASKDVRMVEQKADLKDCQWVVCLVSCWVDQKGSRRAAQKAQYLAEK